MVATSIPKITFTYFNFAGRGEPLRLAAAIGQVPFLHKAVAFKDWPALKPTLPLGQMPFLEVEEPGKDTVYVAQSLAMMRYIGKQGGLYPVDPVEAMQVDSVMDTLAEACLPIELTVGSNAQKLLMFDEPLSAEKILETRKRISTDEKHGLPFFLSYFEKMLKTNDTGWLVGDKVTLADVQLTRVQSWVSSGILDGIPKDLLNGYPLVKAHFKRIEALPAVVAWRTQYPTPYSDFEFDPEAS